MRKPLPLTATPQEKYDNLILAFFEDWEESPGQKMNFVGKLDSINLQQFGFQEHSEFLLYVNTLLQNGLLEPDERMPREGWSIENRTFQVYPRLGITFAGLNYCLKLKESGKNSNRCFVAMKYSPDMALFYDNGILPATQANGFRAIRVDREHVDTDQTINDFIIASIKQSRFCIADFTHQSDGVYFEAGYALGRGLEVIFTCRSDDWDNLHFDVRPMQVIRYSTPEELARALSLKIQAAVL